MFLPLTHRKEQHPQPPLERTNISKIEQLLQKSSFRRNQRQYTRRRKQEVLVVLVLFVVSSTCLHFAFEFPRLAYGTKCIVLCAVCLLVPCGERLIDILHMELAMKSDNNNTDKSG